MFSDGALKYLQSLKHDPNSERWSSAIPYIGIFWADEMPDDPAFMNVFKQDRDSIFRLFSIRSKLWAGDELEEDDQSFWDAARAQVPDYPAFHRVDISHDDRKAQAEAEKEALAGFDTVFDMADEVTFEGDGRFSATFDLTKGIQQSLWQRFLAWYRGR